MSVRTYDAFRPTFADSTCWSIPWVLRHKAETHAEHVYLDVPHQGLQLTYRETLREAEKLAAGLLSAGDPGDLVLVMAPNCAEIILTWFGASLAGMVEVPMNTAYSGSFLEHQVRTTAPRIAVLDAAFAGRFLTGQTDAYASIGRYYILGEGSAAESAIDAFRKAGKTAASFAELPSDDYRGLPDIRAHDLASVFFTSGTTGLSKGVMMTHSHMTFFADECVSLTRLTDSDTYMSVGPLFHGNAQFLAALPALIVGARFVLRERFSASQWIDQIRSSGATVTNFIGVMMDWTWTQPKRPDDADNSLRCIFAAPTASSIVDAFKSRFNVEAFVEVFGLTEVSAPIMTPYGEDRPAGAAGLLVADYFDVRLVDQGTDFDVPDGTVGELVVRAKLPWTICSGYYNMPERTVEAQRNLWFHTGDGLRRDADGWYYFVDRLKDAIRRRGENISSYEIEQAVLQHPDVEQCAVVGIPSAVEAGEDELAVFVVLRERADVEVDVLHSWCRERLPAFASPEYVNIVEELPTTPSGKIRKNELRVLAAELAARATVRGTA